MHVLDPAAAAWVSLTGEARDGRRRHAARSGSSSPRPAAASTSSLAWTSRALALALRGAPAVVSMRHTNSYTVGVGGSSTYTAVAQAAAGRVFRRGCSCKGSESRSRLQQ